MRYYSLVVTLFGCISSICGQPLFLLEGENQPTIGTSLMVSSDGDLSEYTFKWTRGDALGTFDDTALSLAKNYVITESDYEHWLRVTVCDNVGNTVFTKDTWISKLPVMYIDTKDGKPVTSRNNYVSANIRIQGNAEYEEQYNGITEIRGRGQTSWSKYPQKPYKLKLEKKAKLFGFGKSKHWVLIPNFKDKSCLRNFIASKLAKKLGVMSMDMTWVDVVINGEAKGCYMLSQHIRIDKNSVDIFDWESEAEDIADALYNFVKDADALTEIDKELLETTMEQNLAWVTNGMVTFKGKTYNLADYSLKKEYDTTKGYLFEACLKSNTTTTFTTPQNVRFELTAPEYLKTNNEMMTYITDLWKGFETEYCRIPTTDGKNFSEYANMESMVGVWLVNEIMGQDDYSNSRFSYIADNKKIHFGPVWDFDHGSGSWEADSNAKAFRTLVQKFDHIYYRSWFPDPKLCQMAYDAYWNVARTFIMEFISENGEMDAILALLAETGKTNDVLWGDYHIILNPSAKPRTTAEDVEILRKYLFEHIYWLDEQFKSVRTLVKAMNKVCIYPYEPNIHNLTREKMNGRARKAIQGKHLYIFWDGDIYSIDGKKILKGN